MFNETIVCITLIYQLIMHRMYPRKNCKNETYWLKKYVWMLPTAACSEPFMLETIEKLEKWVWEPQPRKSESMKRPSVRLDVFFPGIGLQYGI